MKYVTLENRICAVDNDKVIGEIDFEKINDNTYNIYRTFVSEEYRGKNIASELVNRAFDELRNNRNANIESTCSYCSKFID